MRLDVVPSFPLTCQVRKIAKVLNNYVPYCMNPKLKSQPMSSLIMGIRDLINRSYSSGSCEETGSTNLLEYTDDRRSNNAVTASAVSKTIIEVPATLRERISVSIRLEGITTLSKKRREPTTHQILSTTCDRFSTRNLSAYPASCL